MEALFIFVPNKTLFFMLINIIDIDKLSLS